MTTLQIYSALFVATTLYAILLAWLKHLWEPDLTWLEVIVGTAICLAAPFADRTLNGPLTSEVYEGRVWLAFFVGGLPIVIWQLGHSVRARLQVERRIRGRHVGTRDASKGADALATDAEQTSDTGD